MAARVRRLPPVSGYPMAARGPGLSPLGDCALEAARINDADAGMCRDLLAWVFWLEGALMAGWDTFVDRWEWAWDRLVEDLRNIIDFFRERCYSPDSCYTLFELTTVGILVIGNGIAITAAGCALAPTLLSGAGPAGVTAGAIICVEGFVAGASAAAAGLLIINGAWTADHDREEP